MPYYVRPPCELLHFTVHLEILLFGDNHWSETQSITYHMFKLSITSQNVHIQTFAKLINSFVSSAGHRHRCTAVHFLTLKWFWDLGLKCFTPHVIVKLVWVEVW